jgi:NADPH-dependent curcumin reductase CurA
MDSQQTFVYLASRPGPDNPQEVANFGVKTKTFQDSISGDDFIVVKTLYLSVDPALR